MYEVGDINCVSPSMQFASVLDAPLFSKISDAMMMYYANLNSGPGLPVAASVICFIILLIQIAGPSLLINSKTLWEDGSLRVVLGIVGYIWQGPNTSKNAVRILMSCGILVIFVAYLCVILQRAFRYKQFVHVGLKETIFVNVMSKCILPVLSVHLLSGIPSGIYMVSIGKWGYMFPILLILLVFSYFHFCLVEFVFPRVTIESSVVHEWGSYEYDIILIATAIGSALSTCVGNWDFGKSTAVFPVVMALMWIVLSTLNVIWMPCLNKKTNIAVSAMGYSAAFVCILNVLAMLVAALKSQVLLLILPAAFLILFLILRIIDNKYSIKLLGMCDELMDHVGDVKEILNAKFSSSWDFIVKMRHIVEYWHPWFAQFSMFKYAMDRWKRSYMVVTMYARLLSFFPERTSEMVWVADRISKMRTSRSVIPYLFQFRRIARTRQPVVTGTMKAQLEVGELKASQLTILLRRFWENILQKNTSSFWEDAYKLAGKTTELNCYYERMLDDYPNCADCYEAFIDFSVNLKRDMIQASKLKENLEKRENGEMERDFAMFAALARYPILQMHLSDIVTDDCFYKIEKPQESERQVESVLDMESQVRMVMQLLTKHSKLGSIWTGLVVMIVATCCGIGLIILYHWTILRFFVERETNLMELLIALHRGVYDIDELIFAIAAIPMFLLEGPASISTDVMSVVAPNLYPDAIPALQLTSANVSDKITRAGKMYEQLINAISTQDRSSPQVEKLFQLFTNTTILDDRDVKAMMSQLLIDAQNVLNSITDWNVYQSKDYVHMMRYHSALSIAFQEMGNAISDIYKSGWDKSLMWLTNVLVALCIVMSMTVTLPYTLHLYHLQVQGDAMAESFTYFANTEVRTIINNLGANSRQVSDDVTQASRLSQAAYNHTGEAVKFGFAFFGSFGVVTACSVALYYGCDAFIPNAQRMSDMLATLYTPFSYIELAAMNLLRIYQIDVDPRTKGAESREELLANVLYHYNASVHSLSAGIWGDTSTIGIVYQNTLAFDTFAAQIPQEPDLLLPERSTFEVLATSLFPDALDLVIGQFEYSSHMYEEGTFKHYDEDMMSLLYWLLDFAPINRTDVFVQLVQDDIIRQMDNFMSNQFAVIVVMVCWQVIMCIVMIALMVERHLKIRTAMYLYHFISPTVLTESHNAIMLIETGQRATDNVNFGFSNADEILAKVNEGVVITNKDLVITDFNDAFAQMVMLPDDEIEKARITDVIQQEPDDRSWPGVIVKISDALTGKGSPSFAEAVTAKLVNGQVVDFNCNVICMTPRKAACETEYGEIDSIAFLIDDTTEFRFAEKMIEREQRDLKQMITNLVPKPILEEIESGQNRVCFLASGVTIGVINISSTTRWDYRTTDMLSFVNAVTARFSEEIAKYSLLTCIRISLDSYMFVGGLFGESGQVKEYVKQAIEFSVHALELVPELVEATGTDVRLTIGVHIGGPAVAGIMSLERPNFMILGPVMDVVSEMMAAGVEGHILISQAVYELSFAAGFNIHQHGDLTLSTGNTIATYTIAP